jgi:MerR family transcriptional regulator, copper efflux regulator
MRITEAAQRLGTSPRMLRYRESLGLLPAVRERQGTPRPSGLPARTLLGVPSAVAGVPQAAAGPPQAAVGAARTAVGVPRTAVGVPRTAVSAPRTAVGALRHRQFGDADLDAVALGLAIEQRYDISPAALAFGMRVLCDPRVRAEVAELGRRIGRVQPPPARAIDFEKERALRLLNISDARGSGDRGSSGQGRTGARTRSPDSAR